MKKNGWLFFAAAGIGEALFIPWFLTIGEGWAVSACCCSIGCFILSGAFALKGE